MKRLIIIGMLIAAIFLVSCTQKPIGGDKDEHGCLIAAGYKWCPSTEKCQRMWEEYCEEYADEYRGEEITSFEECVAAGYPVMESYPRQCTANGQTFVEEIDDGWTICTEEQLNAEACTMEYAPVCGDNGKTYSNGCMACASGEITAYKEGECDKMSQEEALEIAQNSECTEQGTLTDEITYNSITKTWWIDLTPNEPKAGCNPACVVGEETLTAEINWRCTGAIPR